MKTVYKYPIEIIDYQVIPAVKAGAIPIHVGLDPNGTPSIWFKVDDQALNENLEIFIVGTGHPLHPRAKIHLGTFVHGSFVWHVFTTENEVI